MPRYVLAVTGGALDGRDDEYKAWYETHHFKDVLAIPGIVGGRRLQTAPMSPEAPPARYLTEFDLETDQPQEVIGELLRRAQSGEMVMSDTIDPSSVKFWLYEPC